MKTIKWIFYTGQCVFSVIVILLGVFYGIRAIIAGQWFITLCFVAWVINGYVNFWRASIDEYRVFRASLNKHRTT
jgi:hypothetical protein